MSNLSSGWKREYKTFRAVLKSKKFLTVANFRLLFPPLNTIGSSCVFVCRPHFFLCSDFWRGKSKRRRRRSIEHEFFRCGSSQVMARLSRKQTDKKPRWEKLRRRRFSYFRGSFIFLWPGPVVSFIIITIHAGQMIEMDHLLQFRPSSLCCFENRMNLFRGLNPLIAGSGGTCI